MNTENNKIIVEFMGIEILPNGKANHPRIQAPYPPIECFKYHSDWNWLMEVVEKIEGLGYWINRIDGDVWIQDNEGNIVINNLIHQGGIEATYKTCISFIKWYNQQNK